MMFLLAVFAPAAHGQIGPLDELELCLTPIVIVITVLVYKLVSRRAAHRADHTHQYRSQNRAGKRN